MCLHLHLTSKLSDPPSHNRQFTHLTGDRLDDRTLGTCARSNSANDYCVDYPTTIPSALVVAMATASAIAATVQTIHPSTSGDTAPIPVVPR